MEPKLIFRARARKDVSDAFGWYEDKRPGLGDQFLLEVQRSIGAIILNTERFPKVHRSFRQAPLLRFPFVMIYRSTNSGLVIMRVFHTKQDPRKKFGRK